MKRSVVSVGTFDGVHRGHQAILAELRRRAKPRSADVTIVTFDPPPRMVLRPDPGYKLLTSLEERVELLRDHGADHVRVMRFDKELASQSPDDFCRQMVDNV